MSQLGRISGQLLKENLTRNGHDLAFETDLLYLSVVDPSLPLKVVGVGINTATPTTELDVNGTTRTDNLEVTTQADLADLTISGETITSNTGILNLVNGAGDQVVYQTKLTVDSISIDSNVISTNTTDTNLEIRPNGTGTVEVYANTNIYGSLTVSGDIQTDGNIIIGNGVGPDLVTFDAQVASDIIPDADGTRTLGSETNKWKDLWVNNIYADVIDTGDIVVDNINLTSRPGNLFYVGTNGSDTNSGTHQNDPFATIKHALSEATSGDTVYIYPGNYVEAFPLTVPVGVTVKGSGIRSVKITPTTATRYNDAFLLNGETTVEDMTVADFFSGGNYFAVVSAGVGETVLNVGTAPFAHTWVSGGTINISGNDYSIIAAVYDYTTGVLTVNHTGPDATSASPVFLSGLIFSCNGGNRTFPDNGYAFRFATDFVVTSRSPYIRNITVLTKGSVTSLSDPLGYNEGDAGKGAYIDGAYATALSKEASMLFHSVTFICPGVDVIVATNGSRVEWLNSFTYYANRSMYLYSSADGFAGDGKTRVKITDTTGTWAAGNTLYYYDTDGTTVLASGVIESIDGDFYNIDGRVLGFEAIADRTTKTITVNGGAALLTSVKKYGTASLALDGVGDELSISPQADFNFGSDNFTLECWIYPTAVPTAGQYAFVMGQSKAGVGNSSCGLYLGSAAGIIYLYSFGTFGTLPGAAVAQNAWSHIALTREGNDFKLWINGTQAGSTLTYAGAMTSATTTDFTIGGNAGYNLYVTGYIDDVKVSKGVARYTAPFSAPTAQLTGDLNTVLLITCNGTDGSTAITDNGITLQDLRTSAGGTASIIDFADYSDFGVEVRSIGSAAVYGNYGIYGDGVGVIAYLVGQNLAYIGNGAATTNDPNTVIQANEIVELNDAKIYYQSVDHKGDFRIGDLFYVNQATGEVSFSNSNVTIGTNLTFDDGLGNITYIDATKIETGDFRISDNTIETLTQDFNVDAATNQINLQSNVTITGNLDVTGNVTVGGNVTIGNESTDTVQFVAGVDSDILPALDSTYDLGTPTERWSTLYSTTLVNASVQISTNVITTTGSNLDLTLQANGTGRIYVPSNNVEITNNLTVNGTTDVQDLNVTGTLTHVGNVTQTGDVNQTGNIDLTGTFTTTGYAQFADIKVDNNIITTTLSNNDLVLDAAGTGRIYVPDSDVEITQDLSVTGFIDVGSLTVDTTISSLTLTAGDIKLENNVITTLTGNNNLELRANGTGLIYVPSNNVQIDNNLTVVGTTNLATTNIGVIGTPATVTHVGAVTQTGDLIQTGNTEVTGTLTVGSTAQFEDIQIDNNIITTTIGNNNLVLEAAGTGKVIVPNDNAEVTGTLTVNGVTSTTTINNTGTVTSDTFSTGNITISGNTIQTTTTNSNLQLQAAGVGFIVLEQFDVQENELRINSGTDMTIAPNGTGIVNINSTQSIKIPVGDNAARPLTPTTGMIRFNTSLSRYEGHTGTAWTRLDGVEDSDGNTKITAELTPGANDNTIRFYANGVEVADLTSTRLNTISLDVGTINVNNNVISTTTTNTNLVLAPNGTGAVRIGNFSISSNTFINTVNNSVTLISQTGDGYVKINTTGGFVIPVGSTLQRPGIVDIGMMRYNTTDERVEVWNGTAWVGVAQGATSGVTAEEATDISILSALIFG